MCRELNVSYGRMVLQLHNIVNAIEIEEHTTETKAISFGYNSSPYCVVLHRDVAGFYKLQVSREYIWFSFGVAHGSSFKKYEF